MLENLNKYLKFYKERVWNDYDEDDDDNDEDNMIMTNVTMLFVNNQIMYILCLQ